MISVTGQRLGSHQLGQLDQKITIFSASWIRPSSPIHYRLLSRAHHRLYVIGSLPRGSKELDKVTDTYIASMNMFMKKSWSCWHTGGVDDECLARYWCNWEVRNVENSTEIQRHLPCHTLRRTWFVYYIPMLAYNRFPASIFVLLMLRLALPPVLELVKVSSRGFSKPL